MLTFVQITYIRSVGPNLGLGQRTDLMVARNDVQLEERGGILIVRTPSNPEFFWGNYIVLTEAPGEAEHERLEQLFAEAFAEQPATTHRSFTWPPKGMNDPAPAATVERWVTAGYDYDVSVILSARTVGPAPHPNRDVDIRAVVDDRDWASVRDLQLLCGSSEFAHGEIRGFLDTRIASWRALAERDHGAWFGAFLGKILVADAGVFWDGGLARFQNVETHPKHRNRGICGTLVSHICGIVLERAADMTLVMEADEDYHAARIYESIGFRRCERIGSLCRYDRAKWNPEASGPRDHP